MRNRDKWIAVAVLAVLLLLLSGLGAFKKNAAQASVTKAEELSGKRLGGVVSAMPENSAEIFFESILGQKISGYTSYDSITAAVSALKTDEVSAVWACDVTAEYLTAADSSLVLLPDTGMSDIQNASENRFEFGFAIKDNEEGRALCEELNEALLGLKNNGVLDGLTDKFIKNAGEQERFYSENMRSADIVSSDKETLYIGISGAVPPIELIDEAGKPYGFCVAFMDELALLMNRSVEFVVLDNETIFTSLMSGRIDAVMCYGTDHITTEGTKKHITTGGYYPMHRYEFVVLGE